MQRLEVGQDSVRDALAFVRGLVAQPENLLAVRLRDGGEVVVIERGVSREGELVAVRLMPEQRTALGRLTRERECTRWQPAHPKWNAHDVRPSAIQVLGRVLSVIHPLGQNGQSEAA